MEIITFERADIIESIKKLWPPYRKAADQRTKDAIWRLVENPSLPCSIGGHYIENGYGKSSSLNEILFGNSIDN